MQGDLLVLDVGSLQMAGNRYPINPAITTPAECQTYCKRTPGCTGWAMCNKTSGCGSGCKAYAKANPAPPNIFVNPVLSGRTKLYIGDYKGPVNPDLKLPIRFFGGLSGSRGCSDDDDDKWAGGVCSLKMLANPANPQFFSKNPAEGWVSGVVLLPPSCKGVSAITCNKCLASKDAAGCLKCAKASAKVNEIGNPAEANYNNRPTWTERCAKCTTLTGGSRAACYLCVSKGAACGQCAAIPLSPNPKAYVNLASCISCTQKSPRTYEECSSCAQIKPAPMRKKCNSCITTVGAVLSVVPFSPIRRIQSGSFCRTCAQAGSFADRCIKCGKEMPYNLDCVECASPNLAVSPAQRTKCYDCAFKAKLGRDVDEKSSAGLPSMCTECISNEFFRVPKALKAQCYACLTDPKVNYKGKYWCNSCLTWKRTTKARNTCLACLKNPGVKSYNQCLA